MFEVIQQMFASFWLRCITYLFCTVFTSKAEEDGEVEKAEEKPSLDELAPAPSKNELFGEFLFCWLQPL